MRRSRPVGATRGERTDERVADVPEDELLALLVVLHLHPCTGREHGQAKQQQLCPTQHHQLFFLSSFLFFPKNFPFDEGGHQQQEPRRKPKVLIHSFIKRVVFKQGEICIEKRKKNTPTGLISIEHTKFFHQSVSWLAVVRDVGGWMEMRG
jgi:hypothetical protein